MKSVETTELSTRRGTFDRGDREYNVTPCHGGDRGFKSPRGRHFIILLTEAFTLSSCHFLSRQTTSYLPLFGASLLSGMGQRAFGN